MDLEEFKSWEEDEVQDLKKERLSNALLYASEKSPFYRDFFEEEGIDPKSQCPFEEIEGFLIDSDDVIENQPPHTDDFLFKSSSNIFSKHRSSGTKGEPKWVHYSYDDWEKNNELISRMYSFGGLDENDEVLNICPYGINVSGFVMTLPVKEIGASAITLGSSQSPPPDEVFDKFSPTAIAALPTGLERFGRKLEVEGTDPYKTDVDSIFIGGEPITEERKDKISKNWDAEVMEFYPSTEANGLMAVECREDEGLHVMEDRCILNPVHVDSGLEVEGIGADAYTELIKEGEEPGNIFINYHHGDQFRNLGSCKCGLPFKKISKPGRRKDEINIAGGMFSPQFFESVVYRDKYQKYLTGEWELLVDRNEREKYHEMKLRLEKGTEKTPNEITNHIREELESKSYELNDMLESKTATLDIKIVDEGNLELYSQKGKPNRIIDKRY